MPNHVENLIIIAGEPDDVKRMLDDIKNDLYGYGTIDFNKVIPMPESLDIICGSQTETGKKMVSDYISKLPSQRRTELIKDDKALEAVLNEQTKNVPDESKECWELGVKAALNVRRYGAPTWYEWSIENWGTKWNAYGYTENTDYGYNDDLCFETAWSAPHPILQALSEAYPNIAFRHKWADEDIGQNLGDRTYIGGNCILDLTPTTNKERLEFACELWGYDMSEMGMHINIPGTDYVRTYLEDYELIELFGKPALFTNDRLTEADVPKGLNLYHIRMTDDGEQFGALEPKVLVNHGGSIITNQTIDFGENGYIELNEENDPNFLGQDLSIDDYISENYSLDETAGFEQEMQ